PARPVAPPQPLLPCSPLAALLRRPAPTSTLFPYTTLFRSHDQYSDNEQLLAKLQAGSAGYDVVVPSDYMVEIMIAEGLLQELDKDRKSTRLNSSHVKISYAVFCLKKKATPASAPTPICPTT